MAFENQGFLDPAGEWIAKCRLDHEPYFHLALKVNEIALSLCPKLDINNENAQHILCASLFARIVELFEASIILVERCIINGSKIIIRSMLNTTFTINAIAKKEGLVWEYIQDDDINRRYRDLKRIKNNPHIYQNELDKEGDDLLGRKINDLEKKRRNEKPRELTVKYLAEKSGMIDFYNTTYSLFSGTEHSSARDMEQYLEISKTGKLIALKLVPHIKTEDIDLLLLTAIETLTYGIDAVGIVFGLNDNRLADIKNEMKLLSHQ
jgi:hypothetical protein